MLPRAAFRALRTRPALVAPRTATLASTSTWLRSYASNNNNNNRPPRDQSDPINFDRANKSRPNPVHPSEQPEFESQADPDSNTAPATEAPKKPQKPLPDLRQGIPSTFAAEFGEAEPKAKRDPEDPNNITEDPDKEPSPGSTGGREGGELPKSAYETSTDRRRNRVANWGYIATLLLGTTTAAYMGRNWENEEEEAAHPEAPNGWTPGLMYDRAYARLNSQKSYYTEPTFTKLLPDMDPAPPLTLVLSLEDLLVHSEWSTKHGWRTAKRPGVDYFLRYLSQYYELVIFTSAKSMDADPVIRKLDPFRVVMWPLYREATRYEKGEYIKDLTYLNRDLSRTIIIDTDPSHVQLQPENAIILPKWKGQPRDAGLVALVPFLEYLAMMSQGGPMDVRQAIKSMEGKDIPVEFARREARLREQFNRDMAEQQKKKGKGSAGGWLMRGLGMDSNQGKMVLSDGTNLAEGMAQGKMMIDMFRDIGRKNYEAMDKEIRENGEKWLKEMAEEEKKMQEEQMKSMKAGAFGWIGSSAPPEEKK